MQTVLIDGDILFYRISAANEQFVEWDDEVWCLWGDAKEAALDLEDALQAILSETGAEDYVLCLTSTKNFRKDVYEPYKASRADKRKPFLLKPLREYAEENHPVEIWENLEADDVMGIMATDPEKGSSRFIYSQDKDLWTIPGLIWDFNTSTVVANPVPKADYQFFYQTLTGDNVDNFPGCPGVGPVAAAKALDADASWGTVKALYEKKGLTEEDALVQARCARILRHSDYDTSTNTIKLWSPEYA